MMLLVVSRLLVSALVLLFVLAIVIMILVVWVISRSKSEEPAPAEQPEGEAKTSRLGGALSRYLPVTSLRLSFREAIHFLSNRMAGLDYRYDVPWYMVVGEPGSGRSTMLDSSDGVSRYGAEDDFGIPTGVRWRFFDGGVLLDIPGQFVVGNDGSAGDTRSWEAILGLLLQHRARRPIDGVVVTIAASDLIGPTADPERGRRKAEQISEKLWRAQKVLGLRFPVYVVVTKCDLVEGFTSFAQELTGKQVESILGWSSSYMVEAVFSPRWVDEAFNYLDDQLKRIEGELFATVGALKDPDGVFLFPTEFQKLRAPLRLYLEQLFRPTAYRDSCPVRGIYFCGASAPQVQALVNGAAAGTTEQPVEMQGSPSRKIGFVADLFEKKIFPECGLARPYMPAFLSRNRTVFACQVASAFLILVLGIGMSVNYLRLQRIGDDVAPMLARLAANMRDEANEARQGTGQSSQRLHRASYVLDSMRSDRSSELRSWFYPTSLFSPLRRRVQRAVVTSYESLVLNPLRRSIAERVSALSTSGGANLAESASLAGSAAPGTAVAPTRLQETTDFRNLKAFDEDLAGLQEVIARYNDLSRPGRGTPEDLRVAISFLHGGTPPSIDLSTPDFGAALQLARGAPFDISLADKERLQNTFTILTQNLFTTMVTSDFLLRDVDDLQQKINDLPKSTYADLQSLRDSIASTESMLGHSDVSWVAGQRTEVRDEVRELTQVPIDNWNFLQTSEKSALRDTVRQQRAKALESLRTELSARQTDITGPVVEWDDAGLRLSPDVETLRLALENILQLGFMSITSDQTFATEVPAGTRPQWSAGPLSDAGNMYIAWERFENEALINCPSAMADALDLLSRDKLGRAMRVLVAQSQSFVPLATSDVSGDEALFDQADNFKSVVGQLTELIRDFDRLGLGKTRSQLLRITTGQTTALMDSLDRRLSEDGPYGLRDEKLGWWDGTRPVSTALGANSPAELAAYLGTQRSQLQRLVGASDGPVTFLSSTSNGRKLPVVVKWRGISDELHRYNDKVAGNSVSLLEEYVLTKIDAIKPDDACVAGIQKTNPSPNDDYFTQARYSFERTVYNRCRVLADRIAYRNYAELEEEFNSTLASKFPFAAYGDGDGIDADPQAVRNFMKLYAQTGISTRDILRSSTHFGKSRQGVVQFLDNMAQVSQLLTPFVVGSVPSPGFEVFPEFRTNRDREVGANQIIEWSMLLGPNKVSSLDQKIVPRAWKFGDPVKVSMRWAKDSTLIPVAPPRAAALSVQDRVVNVEYKGGWSLLRLLYEWRALPQEFSELSDTDPYTLMFQVPTSPILADNAAEAPAPHEAKAFISLHLTLPGQTTTQTLPTFPVKAPQLDQDPSIEDQ